MKRHLLTFLAAAALCGSAWAAPASINLDGDKGSITLDSPVKIYDDGGADGDIGNGVSSTVTLLPAAEGQKVRIDVNSFATGYTDYLYIYNGREVTDDYAYRFANSASTNKVVSTADDGSLTLKFVSAASHYLAYAGFELTASSYSLKDMEVEAVAVTTPTAEVVKGATDVVAARLAITADGESNSATLTGLSGKVSPAAALTGLKVWFAAGYDTFTPQQLLGTAEPAGGEFAVTFASPVEISTFGTYYMYVTADIADDAAAGTEITLSDLTVAATPKSATAEGSATMTVKQGFAGGDFTIGASDQADYASFAEAIAAMGSAIEGSVTFTVEPGTYAEQIVISHIGGTGPERQIVFRAGGEGVILKGANGSTAAEVALATVEYTDYVTFEGFDFQPSTGFSRTILLEGASRHCTVRGCSFTNDIQIGYSGKTRYHILTEAPATAYNDNADYLTVEGCTFTGNKHAIYANGAQGRVAYARLIGFTVEDCTFTGQGSKAIYTSWIKDATIRGNKITTTDAVTDTNFAGIDLYNATGRLEVSGNLVTVVHSPYAQGIWLRTSEGTDGPIRVYNNAVAFTNASNSSTRGFTINTDVKNAELAHNTVSISGTQGSAIYFNGSGADLDIKLYNNLLQNFAPTGYCLSFSSANCIPSLTLANNIVYAESGNAASREGMAESAFTVAKAEFLTSADLHLKSAEGIAVCPAIDYIKKDIDGNWRPAENVSAGAYEFAPLEVVTPVMAEGYPTLVKAEPYALTVAAKWNVSGRAYALLLPAADAAPEAEAVTAGGKSVEIAADAEVTFAFADLADQTDYKVYFVAVSALEAQSAVDALEASTPRYIAPLTVAIDAEEYEEDVDYTVGQSITVDPEIAGGDKPYTYSWTDRQGREVGTDESLVYTLTRPDRFTLTVTSADGQTASAYVLITAYGCDDDADFEDNPLQADAYWKGYADRDYMVYPWYSGGFAFDNSYWAAYNSWSGFGYSNSTSKEFTSYLDDHNLVTGGGHNSATYAVAYNYSPYRFHILADAEGAKLDCVYVTNNMYFYESATKGDGYSTAFADGDYMTVVFTGDDAEGSPVECDLARHADGELDILTDWKRVDLSPLGKVTSVAVSLKSSKQYAPSYVALDDLCYDRSAGVTSVSADSRAVDHVAYFTLDGRHVPATALSAGIYVRTTYFTDGTTTSEKAIIN